ncbi:AgmX/PglI C-terminal domain-containing protein [Pendulispora rubella]|uniref:AgmX/PglI C-terminal domain-containing protein n=1 Tax=Pendulispora rubella TaxID=2741070 RepID=A0ABZ2L6Z9_9BACT
MASLPRSGLAGWIAVYVAAVLVIWPLPLVVVAASSQVGGSLHFWQLFRNGGVYSYLCLGTHTITMILLGVLGASYIAGRRIPGWLLYIVALGPFFVGVAGTSVGHRATLTVLQEQAVRGFQATRIFAEGMAEARSSTILGNTMTAFALTLVALAALFRVASLDGRAIDLRKTRPSGAAMGMAGGVAVFGLLAGLGLRIALKEIHTLPGILVLLAAVAAAILAAFRAPLAALMDSDIVPTLLVLALSTSAAALFLASSGSSLGIASSLHAISGESVDPVQRGAILAQGVSGAGACWTIGFVDALLLFGALLVPVLFSGAVRRDRAPGALALSLAAWAVAILFPVGATVAYAHAFSRDLATYARPRNFEAIAGLKLPTARERWENADGAPALYITRDGQLAVDASGGYEPPVPANADVLQRAFRHADDHAALIVDAATTYAVLLRTLAPVLQAQSKDGGFRGYRLVLTPPSQERATRKLPAPWTGLTGDDHGAIDLQFERADAPQLTIVLEGASARALRPDGKGQIMPTGTTDADDQQRRNVFRALLRGDDRVTRLLVVPRDEDTMATVVRVLDSSHDLPRFLFSVTLGKAPRAAPPPEPPPSPPTNAANANAKPVEMHTGNIAVNGRLSAEAVQRVARQGYGRFRLCFDKGLADNPKLTGKVVVKFTIAADGAVSNASDAGSDLPNDAVVQCIVRSFSSLNFPQPEGGGTVTVIYPILFSASK